MRIERTSTCTHAELNDLHGIYQPYDGGSFEIDKHIYEVINNIQ